MRQFFHTTWTAPAARRPRGVTLIAVGAWLIALLLLGLTLVGGLFALRTSTDLHIAALSLVVVMAMSVVLAGLGTGLLRLQPWAQQLTVVLMGIGSIDQIVAVVGQSQRQFGWIGGAAIVIYLLLPGVRRAFYGSGAGRHDPQH